MVGVAVERGNCGLFTCAFGTAELHLLYARFIMHFLHHLGLVPDKEPFQKLLIQVHLQANGP